MHKSEAFTPSAVLTALARKQQSDPECEVFGAQSHRYCLRPVIKEKPLVRLEKKHGLMLPHDYRTFLKRNGNGGAGPGHGIIPLQHAVGDMRIKNTPTTIARYTSSSENLIPLCQHGCGDGAFIVIGGQYDGHVWEYDDLIGCYLPLIHEPEDLRDYFELPYEQYIKQIPALIERYASHTMQSRVTFYQWYHQWLQA